MTGEEVTEDTALTAEDFSRRRHHSKVNLKHTHTPESGRNLPTETTTSSQKSPVERVAHGYEADLATRDHGSASTTPSGDVGKEGGAPVLCSEDGPDIQDGSQRDTSSREPVCNPDCAEPSDPRTVEITEHVTREETEPNTPST